MEATVREPVSIYTEMTPNPQTLKFVVNRMVLAGQSADFPDEESATHSPLASQLFGFPSVKGVFFSQNFITITKHPEHQWEEIIVNLKAFIKQYISDGKEIIEKGYEPAVIESASDDPSVVSRIKDLLETYVKPAVEMDGGAIQFKSFEKGIVTLQLQGACSGCPSSTVTLKAGIEGMMKRMLPEVKEVIAEAI